MVILSEYNWYPEVAYIRFLIEAIFRYEDVYRHLIAWYGSTLKSHDAGWAPLNSAPVQAVAVRGLALFPALHTAHPWIAQSKSKSKSKKILFIVGTLQNK